MTGFLLSSNRTMTRSYLRILTLVRVVVGCLMNECRWVIKLCTLVHELGYRERDWQIARRPALCIGRHQNRCIPDPQVPTAPIKATSSSSIYSIMKHQHLPRVFKERDTPSWTSARVFAMRLLLLDCYKCVASYVRMAQHPLAYLEQDHSGIRPI